MRKKSPGEPAATRPTQAPPPISVDRAPASPILVAMLFKKCLLPTLPFVLAATAGSCGASDFEPDADPSAAETTASVRELETPAAGPVPSIESGYVQICGGPRLDVRGGDLETTGWATPNGLKGTMPTAKGVVELDAKLSVSLLRLGAPTVTGGSLKFDGTTYKLKKSKLTMSWDGWTPVSLAGTVKLDKCAEGFVMSVEFSA